MAVSAAANVELVRPNSHAVADNARPCSLSKHVHMNVKCFGVFLKVLCNVTVVGQLHCTCILC